jgi:hypothetical protein
MITRRHLLGGGTVFAVFYPICAGCQSLYKGCSITVDQADALLDSEQVRFSYDSVTTGSGDRDFDRALAQTLQFLSDRFFVLPGFAFFDESGSPNAFASHTRRMGRSDGDVLFGRKLFRQIMSRRERPEIARVTLQGKGSVSDRIFPRRPLLLLNSALVITPTISSTMARQKSVPRL